MGRTLDEDDVLKEIDRWIGYLDEDMITRIKISIKKIPSAQPYTEDEIQKMQDLEQAELDKAFELGKEEGRKEAQPKSTRTFVELVVKYPDPELCTYKEYKGKPYYSIKYIENGETYVGYGTYKPEVLSQYLKEYFILSALPEPYREEGGE